MDNSLTFLYVGYLISIVMLTVSWFLTIVFIIPLQWKLANVKNGLIKLRRQLRTFGWSLWLINTAAITSLTTRFFITDPDSNRYIIVLTIFFFSLGFLLLSIIFVRIYHQQYSPENIKMHARIDRLEKAEVKRENKRK